jgi:hypothetical protein
MRILAVAGGLLALAGGGCGPSSRGDTGGTIDAGAIVTPDATPLTGAFPAEPIIDTMGGTVPADVATLFAQPADGSPAPCLIDPDLGALLPRNWLRLLVEYLPSGGQNLFEIRLQAETEPNDLVVYTAGTSWKMPAAMWRIVTAAAAGGAPITISVRGAVWNGTGLTAGPSQPVQGEFSIAPADAPGAIVYWTISNGTALKGFTVGNETVHDVLRPGQVGTGCVGCHASTPDGDFIAFTAYTNPDAPADGHLDFRSLDGSLTVPPWLSDPARTIVARQIQAQPVFSPAHWSAGDRIVLGTKQSTVLDPHSEIIWIDLEATSDVQGVGWGVLARGSAGGMIATPSWTSDGQTVLFNQGSNMIEPSNHTDLYTIPYADRLGGDATALAGGSDPAYSESYASFSPDDQLIAFSRVGTGDTRILGWSSEVMVLPAGGGTPTRLESNDPPACTGQSSPGVTNSWPKWSPAITTVGGKTFYWVTFSSTRRGGIPQLYVGGVVVDGAGAITTYPAVYLWNQPAGESNHTPVWDVFDIPID